MNKAESQMWDGKSYDEFQIDYQFISGRHLVERLETYVLLEDKGILDLGCGNGTLTNHLARMTESNITGVDSDDSMLAVFRRKYHQSNISLIRADIPEWLSKQKSRQFDIVFSNAVFHWFGSQSSIKFVLANCHNILKQHGILALRFSLKDNAREIKDNLRKRLSEFLGDDNVFELSQSQIEYDRFKNDLIECGFNILYGEEIIYTPFSNINQDFQFMIKSQPIHKMMGEMVFREFKNYLENHWNKEQVKVKSCHAVFIAQSGEG